MENKDNLPQMKNSSLPQNEGKSPVFIRLTQSFHLSGFGTVVVGEIEHGSVCVGDKLEFQGYFENMIVVCRGLEIQGNTLVDKADKGSIVGILLGNVDEFQIQSAMNGAFLQTPGAFKISKSLEAKCRFTQPILSLEHCFSAMIAWKNVGLMCKITLPEDKSVIKDDTVKVQIELLCATYVEVGESFSLCKDGQKIADGTFTAVEYIAS